MTTSILYFPISALFIISLIVIVFFSKKRVKNQETEIYKISIITNLLEVIATITILILGLTSDEIGFGIYLGNRLDFVFLLMWIWSFFLYILYISFKDRKKSSNIYNITYKATIIFNIVSLFAILLSPLNIYAENDIVYAYGDSVNILYTCAVIYVIGIILCILINIKHIWNKKYIPLLSLILFMIILLIVRQINPGLVIISAILSYIDLIMFFTIENPDIKLVNELELAKSNAELANNAKSDFLSNMSHEIRTPLNAIVGFSNSIIEDKTLKEAKEEAKDIITASENLLEIVNGILDISKIEAGKMEVVPINYAPYDMYDDITKLIIPRIGEKPIELKTIISKDIPKVLNGDMGKIKEIITNLLTNAAKYTEEGSIIFEVNCINQKDICKLAISIEDTGRGIKPDKIDKLFTKFNRLDEDKNSTLEGTGLGLAITKSLVEMMGGKIIVQSKYGIGSKFTVYIPQKIVDINELNENQDNKEIKIKNYSKKKVLVVDDNNLNLKVATRILKNYHIVPDTLTSGIDCLEKVKKNNYDLILMDDMMPKMSGVVTFKELKKNEKFKTPVVILTANAISGMRERYLEEGLDDYLAKPIDKIELDRILNKFLNK